MERKVLFYGSKCLIALFVTATSFGQISSTLTNLNYEQLVQVKKAIEQVSEVYLPAYKKLLNQADSALLLARPQKRRGPALD